MCIELVEGRDSTQGSLEVKKRLVWLGHRREHIPQGSVVGGTGIYFEVTKAKWKCGAPPLKNYCNIQDGKSRALGQVQSSLSTGPCAPAQVTCPWSWPWGWERGGKDLGTSRNWSEFHRKWIYPISKGA